MDSVFKCVQKIIFFSSPNMSVVRSQHDSDSDDSDSGESLSLCFLKFDEHAHI